MHSMSILFLVKKFGKKVIRTTHNPFSLQLFGRHLDNFYLKPLK
jgi:hypothetical protein